MADEIRKAKYGEHVIYVDTLGNVHDALVTNPWEGTCINVVYVTTDETRNDVWGRQIERQGSCTHMSRVPVHGNYWRYPEETGKSSERPFAARA